VGVCGVFWLFAGASSQALQSKNNAPEIIELHRKTTGVSATCEPACRPHTLAAVLRTAR
jgi:hypothetical protein